MVDWCGISLVGCFVLFGSGWIVVGLNGCYFYWMRVLGVFWVYLCFFGVLWIGMIWGVVFVDAFWF